MLGTRAGSSIDGYKGGRNMKQIWVVVCESFDDHPSIWVFEDLPKAVRKFNALIAEGGGPEMTEDEWTVCTCDSWVYLRNPEVEQSS